MSDFEFKILEIKKIQDELSYRHEVENEAIKLIEDGKCLEAIKVLEKI